MELIKYSHMHGDVTSYANELHVDQAASMENFQFFEFCELKYTMFLSDKITDEVVSCRY